MPTWGYALVVALALALATYALWPTGAAPGIAPFPAKIATPFTVSGQFGEQQVDSTRIRVAGFERPTDSEAVGRFTSGATGLRSDAKNVVDGIDAQAARAWGIDGSRRLVAGDEERQWGEAAGTAAVYDPARRRAYVLSPEAVRGLTASSARLDKRELVEVGMDLTWFTADRVRFEHATGRWSAVGGARPPIDGRMVTLFSLLRAATLAGPGSAPAEATAEHELRWPGPDGIEGRIRILAHGAQAWLAADNLPAQPLDPAAATSWRAAFAALAVDRLVDPMPAQAPDLVTISRGGSELLRLERRGEPGDSGAKPWTVVWPGGAEPADELAGERILDALKALVVRNPVRTLEPIGPDVLTIEIRPEGGAPLRTLIAGTTLWSGGWAGTADILPEPLNALVPATFLDPRPCPLDPLRAVKLQRRWRQEPGRDEVAARAGGGSWTRTFPAGAVPLDPPAVQRVVRALCRLKARHVRMTTPADRLLPHDAELAIRFAPKEARRTGAEDEVELIDTVPQEHGWTMTRSGLGWTMLDINGGLAFTIDAADAEVLLADTASDRLYPVAAGLVTAIEVGGSEPFRLERSGETWQLTRTGKPAATADALAVRRLLRALAALRASATTAPPAGDLLAIALETVDKERVVASFATPGADGVAAMTVRGGVLVGDREAWSQVELRPAVYLRP